MVIRLPTIGDLGEQISAAAFLDRLIGPGMKAGSRLSPRIREVLQGVPLGEPLHPVLTDVTIGAWTSSFLLDLVGGQRAQVASRRLLGLGVLSAVPTVASGAVDWIDIDTETQRVGVVHAITNALATAIYAWSWSARVRGRHAHGVRLGLVGATVATVGGGLGGYMVYRRATGVNRSLVDEGPTEWTDIGAMTPSNSPTLVQAGDAAVVWAIDQGTVAALGDTCSHQGAPLHEGTVSDGCVRCPWHGSEFRLIDGSVAAGPATSPQPVYETRAVGGRYQVRMVRRRDRRAPSAENSGA